MRRATVLYNPAAGVGRALPVSERACRVLASRGVAVERHPTTGPGSATALARSASRETDLLVVAGGDGSIREALTGLGTCAPRIPIAVIPCGNANVLARELGIPLAAGGALDVLAHGVPRAVDVGCADGELFLAMVGIGWDARTTADLAALRQTRLGARWYAAWADSAYFACGLAALLTRPPPPLTIAADGRRLERRYRAAIIANHATYGKGWSMAPSARFDDGLIHYQARKHFGAPFVAIQLLAAMLRRPVPGFVSDGGTGTHLVIRAERPFPVHVDGDFRGFETALALGVRPAAARVVVPVELARVAELQRTGGL